MRIDVALFIVMLHGCTLHANGGGECRYIYYIDTKVVIIFYLRKKIVTFASEKSKYKD
jgi:hypothetical protein